MTFWLKCGLRVGGLLLAMLSGFESSAANEAFNYRVGRGSADITGPAVGAQMFGFVRADQISEGIHLRQRARTFIIAEAQGERRIVLTTVDLGSMTHEITRTVLERLAAKYGHTYGRGNVIIAATHTHAAPGGFWHYGADTPVGTPLYGEYFDAIVEGIVGSITAAHEDLAPGNVLIATGDVEDAGAQRSAKAYENNPAEERERYATNTDKRMTLLKFVRAEGPIGMMNWFAVHPTSMTYYNKLISSDNKGYAALKFEQKMRGDDPNFVAAFAQTNCGDVTPNLNLDNTGPGEDEFDSTRIIGGRQLDVALELYQSTMVPLTGDVDGRHQYVDFSTLVVSGEFTGHGEQRTCRSAYGYAFAAGSTEDGGGHPLFTEGMTERNPLIDGIAAGIAPIPPPSDELRHCHLPKATLFAPGGADPPAQPQIQPIGVARIGQLVLAIGPAEYTTMTGRRIRAAVAEAFDSDVNVVIAGFANGYAGYVTTYEEYQTQQYEGGHTLFGPWTEAGYRQQFAALATALANGSQLSPGPTPRDIRDEVERTALETEHDLSPPDAEFGAVVSDAEAAYLRGEQVAVTFWTGTPRNEYQPGDEFLAVEMKHGGDWHAVATDADWETKCRFVQPRAEDDDQRDDDAKPASPTTPFTPPPPPTLDAYQVTITWDIPPTAKVGTYRIAHFGRSRSPEGNSVRRFTVYSRPFAVE